MGSIMMFRTFRNIFVAILLYLRIELSRVLAECNVLEDLRRGQGDQQA